MTTVGSTAPRPRLRGRIGRLGAVVALVAVSSGVAVSSAVADGPTTFSNVAVINIPAIGAADPPTT